MDFHTYLLQIDGEFQQWSTVTQGVVLGAFFYGYILTQIPGGFLAHHYGGKNVFLAGIFGTAVFTLLTPPLAKIGYGVLVFARFAEGLLEGVTYPAMHVMWSHWAPVLEKTKLATFAFSGSYFGTVISIPLSAVIGQALGWPFIFYFFGLLGLLWCLIWARRVSDFPATDPHITTEELTLLQRDAVGHTHYHECSRSSVIRRVETLAASPSSCCYSPLNCCLKARSGQKFVSWIFIEFVAHSDSLDENNRRNPEKVPLRMVPIDQFWYGGCMVA
ncbi:hypothetical protein Y032_0245g3553 [Ancylostoma ceylanicum]|uniref:Major facilitator superfamily (MFS) profile domain-containing protein n=1 Tax=Ancylostoma ceylanicum TaxID=53326 RepID=A0A016SDW4_9BILA|nr:hypothetical protein Y032_0245g3553 [Ancylostoma ceylanicum]